METLTYTHTYLHKDMIFVHFVLATPISLVVLGDICLVFSKEKKWFWVSERLIYVHLLREVLVLREVFLSHSPLFKR
jgi:hypothetical protein